MSYITETARALELLPSAKGRDDRLALKGTIGVALLGLAGEVIDAQKTGLAMADRLLESQQEREDLAEAYRIVGAEGEVAQPAPETDDSDAHRRQLALGKLLDEIIEYTCKRIAHLPALEGEARQMTLETLVASQTTFQNLDKLLSLAGVEASDRWIISDHVDRLGAALESTEEPT